MRIASFNVENMFRRPIAFNQDTWDQGKPILEAYAALQDLFEKPAYSDSDKAKMVELMDELGLDKDDDSEWVFLRRSRGQLVKRPRQGPMEVIASGRGDWIGWLELKKEAVTETATRNTARVINDVDADVLAVIEAEDRPALLRFNRDVLKLGIEPGTAAWSYRHVMLIDGNDDRGIDVGLFTKDDWPIVDMRSHVDDADADGNLIFSRDCAEYALRGPNDTPLLIMVNHFKSKGYGSQADSTAKRKEQAARAAEIYKQRRADGWERVAIVGDFNDTPDSDALAPLIEATDVKDISEHSGFDPGVRTGTYGTGNDKIDYLLFSPELFDTVQAGGINRKGLWHGPRVKNPWPMFDTLTEEKDAASDHAAVWAELAL